MDSLYVGIDVGKYISHVSAISEHHELVIEDALVDTADADAWADLLEPCRGRESEAPGASQRKSRPRSESDL